MDDRTGPSPEEIVATVAAVRERAAEAARRLVEELELERRMRESPLATLAVAAGAGFVLGGGVWPALRPLLRSAVRTALQPQNLVALAAAAAALAAASHEEEAGATAPQEPTPTAH